MQNDQYTVESLLADESFIAYCNNEPMARKAWELRIEQDDNLRKLVEEARRYVELIKVELTDVSQATAAFTQLLDHRREEGATIKRIGARKRNWIWAAASVAAVVITGWWLITNKKETPVADQAIHQTAPVDAAPGRNTAVLVLADGSVIELDSTGNGEITRQGNARIIKTADGQVQYQQESGTTEPEYHTMQTPKGGQYKLVLPDGTRVWLNAASSIRYPTSFIADERIVEVTGEVYFEVATVAHSTRKNENQPFTVKNGGMEVHVLGTHFNINSYDDEGEARVTLLEGSVQVSAYSPLAAGGKKTAMLKPGEQARLAPSGVIKTNANVNLDEVMAWKKGLFDFNSADINTIMRQIARWYDLEVSYEGTIPTREFSGKITRNTNVSNVLRILEQSNIHFRLEQKRIIVTP